MKQFEVNIRKMYKKLGLSAYDLQVNYNPWPEPRGITTANNHGRGQGLSELDDRKEVDTCLGVGLENGV